MKDIIAGRPVFGNPSEPGGFNSDRQTRPSGLMLVHAIRTMAVLDDFIMMVLNENREIGKALFWLLHAILPKGHRLFWIMRIPVWIQNKKWRTFTWIASIWDNGELVVGFGEFLENNKQLVPSGYNKDCGHRHIGIYNLMQTLNNSLRSFKIT